MRRDVDQLSRETFDVAIVGGGMHGAWIALRAVAAGFRVALVEQDDFGAGTSANSLQILHGGLRYLQQLDFARMRASIAARREFALLAPHLVRPLPCVMPLQSLGLRSPWTLGPALLANDLISCDRNRGVAPGACLPRGQLLSGADCAAQIAALSDCSAVAGARWWDLQALDAGRLTLEPLLQAARAGAVVANHVQAQHYVIREGRITGLSVTDRVTGRTLQIGARSVINATGPGAGRLSAASGLPAPFLPPVWIGGLNLVLRRSLGIDAAVALSTQAPTGKRELFLVPWRTVTLIGTAYWPVDDPAKDADAAPADAVRRFVDEAAAVAPRAGLTLADVARVHWGLLPLDRPGASLPARSPVLASGLRETGAEGLVVVIGEKLTSAPILAKKVLERAVSCMTPAQRVVAPRQQTAAWIDSRERQPAIPDAARTRLAERYGERWPEVAGHAAGRPQLLAPLWSGISALGAEVVHAIRCEMALSLEDIVLRRLGLGDGGHPGLPVLQACADIAALEWNWTPGVSAGVVADLDARLRRLWREDSWQGV